MSTTRKELKDNAKHALRGNWTWAVVIALINGLVVWILTSGGHKLDSFYMNFDLLHQVKYNHHLYNLVFRYPINLNLFHKIAYLLDYIFY